MQEIGRIREQWAMPIPGPPRAVFAADISPKCCAVISPAHRRRPTHPRHGLARSPSKRARTARRILPSLGEWCARLDTLRADYQPGSIRRPSRSLADPISLTFKIARACARRATNRPKAASPRAKPARWKADRCGQRGERMSRLGSSCRPNVAPLTVDKPAARALANIEWSV
ncbi:hypothetical protein KM043_000809 [Ampulex compressa]|nr:hypothetical protein KM043_000809 [Ampulex compressa]